METLGFSHFLQEPGEPCSTSWLRQSDGEEEDKIPLEDNKTGAEQVVWKGQTLHKG